MDTPTFGSLEMQVRRHGAASRLLTYAAVRMVAALIAIGLVPFGGSAVAHADPLGFFDQWFAHDSSMQLSRDGTGTLVLGDGVLNTDQWAVTWVKNPSDSITITLATLKSRSGPGMGNAGDQYFATIQPDPAGEQVLYMHPTPMGAPGHAMTFCTLAEARVAAPGSPCAF